MHIRAKRAKVLGAGPRHGHEITIRCVELLARTTPSSVLMSLSRLHSSCQLLGMQRQHGMGPSVMRDASQLSLFLLVQAVGEE